MKTKKIFSDTSIFMGLELDLDPNVILTKGIVANPKTEYLLEQWAPIFSKSRILREGIFTHLEETTKKKRWD